MYKFIFLSCITLIISATIAFPQQKSFPSKQIRHATQHFGLLTGLWFPVGNIDALGSHPSLGFQWGLRHLQNELDFTLNFRFIKTPAEYAIKRDGQLYYSRSFFGGYLGLDYKYYFIIDQQKEASILFGIGYDGFSLDRNEIPSGPYEIGSLNLNAGFRFNIYTHGETYFGLQPRYNFIRYGNKGGTSFSGNAISVDLFVGGIW